jgi:hypothetical protein
MSVDRFFLDGFRDEAAYEALKASTTFPLVRELEFKYGLKVLRYYTGNNGRRDMCQMAHKNGLAVCRVWTDKDDSGKTAYFYRSPYFVKDRGESREDKETLHSVKISSLMATLTRREVVPDMENVSNRNTRHLRSAIELMRRALGKSVKENMFTNDEIHALLLTALGKSPNSDWVKVNQNKCQEELDKYEEADRVRKLKSQEVERMFLNPFYMIGVDGRQQYLIGKFKLSKLDQDMKWETVESFKRYSSYEQVPDLIPLMTMVKVAYENTQYSKAGVLPITDLYDEGLDAAFFYNATPGDYDCAWMVTSCT